MEFLRTVRSLLAAAAALILGQSLVAHECVAQEQPAASQQPAVLRVDHSAVNANVGGLHLCVPEKWSVLDLVVTNPLDEQKEILSATYFDGAPTLQYGRRVWVPARARLTTWLPVLLPKLPAGSEPRFDIHSVVVDPTQAQEVLHRESAGGRLHSGIVPARVDRPITGYMGPTIHDAGRADPAYDLVIAGRANERLSRKLTFFDPQSRIPDDFSLSGVDHLVISDDMIHEDPVRLAAIRRWIHAGGYLWVMLDRADPQLLERIAGDEFPCSVVDRVGLTTVRIDSKKKDGQTTAFEFELEQAVDLVRVVLADREFQVGHTVNGWPAAFWKSFGEGRILVTTLGAPGWMRLRLPQDSQPDGRRDSQGRLRAPEPDPQGGAPTQFVVQPPMQEIAHSFFLVPTAPRPSIAEVLEAQAGEYVGYAIPPRWQIAGLLTGFGGAVVVLGIWLRRKGALEHLGWSGPVLSVMAALVLLAIGGLNRHAIPATVAVVEFVQPVSGTDDIRSQGAATFYRPEAGRWEIASARGGRMLPDMTGQEGTTRRLVWSDLDAWSWQNLTQTAPQSSARFQQEQTLAQRIEARATFDADGLAGRLVTPSKITPEDALLATRTGQLGVALAADGAFRVAADGVLGRDQYLAAGILSDEQDRRRRTNQQVLVHLRRDGWPGPPLLMLWTDDSISAFQFDSGRRSLGAALVAIPLVLERPAAGAAVRIPAPFLDYRDTLQPSGEPPSPLWDHSRREWNEYATAASVWLKFQLPLELLPLQLTSGRLEIQVTGPLGRLDVLGLHREPGDHRPGAVGGQAISIHRWDQPVGKLSLPLNDASVLIIGPDGGLVLGIAVKGPEPTPKADPQSEFAEKPNYWRIEELSLELTGKVVERE